MKDLGEELIISNRIKIYYMIDDGNYIKYTINKNDWMGKLYEAPNRPDYHNNWAIMIDNIMVTITL